VHVGETPVTGLEPQSSNGVLVVWEGPTGHEVSVGLKPDPEIDTVAPSLPAIGVSVILGENGLTVNTAEAESPPEPVTVIVYVPVVAVEEAVNEALTLPLVTVQEGLVINAGLPVGVLVTPQAESLLKKPPPVITTVVPPGPEAGLSMT